MLSSNAYTRTSTVSFTAVQSRIAAWCFEYIHQCKASKRPTILLKLDFTKAFDTIEHEAILRMLQCKGFDDARLAGLMGCYPLDLLQFYLMECLVNILCVALEFGMVTHYLHYFL